MSDGGALVLVSGGIESTVCLALAARHGDRPVAVAFDYGQRNRRELAAAERVADAYGCDLRVVALDLGTWGDSPLTGGPVLERGPGEADRVPAAYVAGRNIVFLSIAMSIAETRGLGLVYFGAAGHDAKYPDCRSQFVASFQAAANLGLNCAQEGRPIFIRTPLIGLTKPDIIRAATGWGVPLELTWSCYGNGEQPCGDCGACRIRAIGFAEAGVPDPALGP
jgi:7-cyano-7-deazaguanine synthase